MALDPLVPGTQYQISLEWVSGDAYVPSNFRTRIDLDSPKKYPTGLRLSKVFDPGGGSDSGAAASGNDVVFTFTPTETATMECFPGVWSVLASVGSPTTQTLLVPVVWDNLTVRTPTQGALPHG